MRIALLSPFYPYRGGIAQFSEQLYNELCKSHEVMVFSFSMLYPSFLFPGKTQYVTNSDSAIKVEPKRVLNSINPISYIQTARQINGFKPDVVIIPYWMSFLAPALGSVCRCLDKTIKVVSLVHNAIPHEQTAIDRLFANYFFRRCDAFIVMSEPVKHDLLKLQKGANVHVQAHPIYDQYGDRIDKQSACLKLGMRADKKNLLFFGLIRDYKGLDLLIEAMSMLNEDYQLIIAGECYGSFDKYANLIEQSPYKDNIFVFEEYISDSMVPILFSAADVLVLPYRSATQSGVVALAYQLELPMIGTDVGALGETIRKSNTGLVIDSCSAKSIATGIEAYFESQLATVYIENLKKEKTRLSWSSFTQSIESFIIGLL